MEQKKDFYPPLAFFLLVFGLTWIPWLIAVAIGESVEYPLIKILIAAGGVGPAFSALILIYSSKEKALRKDYWQRVFNIRLIRSNGYLFIFLAIPIIATLAILISTLFGQSLEQFEVVEHLRKNLLMIFPFMIFVFFFGPVPEELGWRGFWLDGLRTRFNGLTASFLLGCTWAAWHLPLFFINGYPLADFTSNYLKMFVYFTDLIPRAIIFTYVFYHNRRSILAAMLFHFIGNFTGMIIEISPITEMIQLILLAAVSVVIVHRNKDIFFHKQIVQIRGGKLKIRNEG